MIFLFDTSALVKRYLHEKGSVRVRRLLQTGGALFYQTFLTPLEITSACYRQHRDGRLSIEELSFLLRSYAVHSHSDYLQVPYSESLIGLAGALVSRYPLRALDAIQLASALELRNALPQLRLRSSFFPPMTDSLELRVKNISKWRTQKVFPDYAT